MNNAVGRTNENVNYPIHANSSGADWTPSTSDQGSLAALMKNNVIVVRQNAQFLPEVSIQPVQGYFRRIDEN